MSKAALPAAILGLALFASACADDGLFASCPFDNKIQAVCNATNTQSELSCVVEQHPQCPDDGTGASPCLSWRGDGTTTTGVCTKTCSPTGGDCPSGSQCTAFDAANAKYYCVEAAALAK